MLLKLNWLFIKRTMGRHPAATAALLAACIQLRSPRPSPHGSLPASLRSPLCLLPFTTVHAKFSQTIPSTSRAVTAVGGKVEEGISLI